MAPQAKRGSVRGHLCPGEAADLDVLGRRARLPVTRSAIDQLPVERIDVAGGASDPCVLRARCNRERRMIEWRSSASRVATEAGCGVGGETKNPGMATGHPIERFAVTDRAVPLPEVLRPRLVRPRRGVTSEARFLIVHGPTADLEGRVLRDRRDMRRRRRRHADRNLRVGMALQAEPGNLRRGCELQIRDGDVQWRHRHLRVAGRAVDRCVVEARRCTVAALTTDGSRYEPGRRAQRVDVRRGRWEGGMAEARGHSAVRMAAEAGGGRGSGDIDMEGRVLRVGGVFRLRVAVRAARDGEIELRISQRRSCLPRRVALLARLEVVSIGDRESCRLRRAPGMCRYSLQRTVGMAEEAIGGPTAGSGAGAAPELRRICRLRTNQTAMPGILVGWSVAGGAVD